MNQKALGLTVILAIASIGAGLYIYNLNPVTEKEVWDCTFQDSELCEQVNISEYRNCHRDGITNENYCRSTDEGLEDISIFTDTGNFIDSPITNASYDLETLNIGHNTAWDAEFSENGTLVYTEMDGKVVKWRNGSEIDSAEVNTSRIGNSGLLGVALDPNFEENNHIYLYYYSENRSVELDTHDEVKDPIYNRVSRFTFENGELTNEEVLIDEIEGNRGQSGGRLVIGPDGNLWVTTGDAEYGKTDNIELHERILDRDFLGGKVLRVGLDGSVPEDNPFNSTVYAAGFRNPQGIDFHPETGQAFVSMHGPTRHDEVNAVEAGENYGWPAERCSYDNPDSELEIEEETKDPAYCFQNWTMAPSGTTFVDDPEHEWRNSYFVTGLRAAIVYRIMTDESGEVTDSEVFYFKDQLGFEEVNTRLRNIEFYNDSLYLFGDGHGAAKITPKQ